MSNMFGRIHTLRRSRTEAANYDFLRGELPPGTVLTSSANSSYVDADGTLRYAAANKPRFEWDYAKRRIRGLLLEGGSTNIVPNSVYTGGSSWTISIAGTTVVQDYGIAPDGSKTSALLSSAGTSNGRVNPGGTFTVAVGDAYTYSMYVRLNPGGIEAVAALLPGSLTVFGGSRYIYINTKTGVLSAASLGAGSYGKETLGNGWVRIWMTLVGESAATVPIASVDTRTVNSIPCSAECWGIQVEKGISRPSSFILTKGTSATRAGDALADPSVNWYNKTAGGTMLIELDPVWLNATVISNQSNHFCQLSDGTTANRVNLGLGLASGTMSLRAHMLESLSNTISASQTINWFVAGQRTRAAFGFDSTGFGRRANGLGSADASGAYLPVAAYTRLELINAAFQGWGAHLRLFRFYPTRRTDLPTLTMY